MSAYYNEIDPYAAQWLRNLIAAGHIAPGEVDDRSILDVRPDDLAGFTQCHFFAGVGVWSHALRLAGWPDDKPVWTGSCPCQPFSVAGAGGGFNDERHLWPYWHFIIEQRRPPVVFGEQVEAAIRHGWLDLVQADMEGSGYAFASVGIPAAGVGAPHIRQRLWFVADTERDRDMRSAGYGISAEAKVYFGGPKKPRPDEAGNGSATRRLDHHHHQGLEGLGRGHQAEGGRGGAVRSVAEAGEPLPTNGYWGGADWLPCRDGKWRPVEPGTFPLAHGATARVGRLRAYGNAIVAEAAAQVIAAYMECRP
ncbi:MAG: DNA cytosine methyltransferase [Gammaproteobacteria bacterium]|nr:DNA cytosine methyltransferase [Gammaproteobacteria bacterium]MBU1732252.1 DNA cytosine methyltransferase [Gammaproteobacteria bacterium]MBU1893822.1 DNA cytosine methyltransferase [Gammaproteobacteria bacterium]